MEFKHIPIMLNDCINNLNIKPDGIYVDATLGGAGHSSEIVKNLSENGLLIGIDKDQEAIAASKERLETAKCKVLFVNDDFKNYKQILQNLNIEKVDGVLIDLGVSSYQIDNKERGFSYIGDGKLDMRMNQNQKFSAFDVVNTYSYEKLVKILYEYGEESFAKNIVRNIISAREKQPITTTKELVYIIEKSVPAKVLHKGGSVAKKTFQAIRIEVNGELDGLNDVLVDMIDSLNEKGRLCVLTFHSLEDRITKTVFKENATGCICPKNFPICVCNHKEKIKLPYNKPILPSEQEQLENSRSKSCKLRVAEKI